MFGVKTIFDKEDFKVGAKIAVTDVEGCITYGEIIRVEDGELTFSHDTAEGYKLCDTITMEEYLDELYVVEVVA